MKVILGVSNRHVHLTEETYKKLFGNEKLELVKELISKLDIEYNLKGKVAKFGEFLGSTPMTIIIKNGRMVHGYIGSMDTDTLTTFTSLYGVSKNEEN